MGLASLTHLMYRLKRIPCPGPVLGFKEGWKQKAVDRLLSVLLQQQRRTKQGILNSPEHCALHRDFLLGTKSRCLSLKNPIPKKLIRKTTELKEDKGKIQCGWTSDPQAGLSRVRNKHGPTHKPSCQPLSSPRQLRPRWHHFPF